MKSYRIKMTSEGIKETLDLIAFARAAVEAYKKIMEDKKLTFSDAVYVVPLFQIGAEAYRGIRSIPKEFADLNDVELDILKSAVGEVVQKEGYQDVFTGLAQAIKGFITIFKASPKVAVAL